MTPGSIPGSIPGNTPVKIPDNIPDDNPASDTRNPTGTTPLSCCGQLRCKTMYYRPDERPGKIHESDTATHWCLLTQQPVGPDNQEVKPSLCRAGRVCYQKDG